jgi:hypothetical protein
VIRVCTHTHTQVIGGSTHLALDELKLNVLKHKKKPQNFDTYLF